MGTRPTAFRLKDDTLAQLEEMSKASNRSRTAVVELGIKLAHAHHLEALAEGRERGRRATALLAELRKRLGDLGIEDGQGIGYSDSGPIAVQIGDTTFVQHDDGTITAGRGVAGRSEMAIVGEDGIAEWMVTGPTEPALN